MGIQLEPRHGQCSVRALSSSGWVRGVMWVVLCLKEDSFHSVFYKMHRIEAFACAFVLSIIFFMRAKTISWSR